jgi:hypothetical protein
MQIPPNASLIDALARIGAAERVQRFADRLAEIGAVASPAAGAASTTASPVAPPAPPATGEAPRRRGSVIDLVV